MSVIFLADAGGWAVGGVAMVFLLMALLASLFWLWMLIDAIMNEPSGVEKIVWVLVIFFLHLLGALLYFFVRRNQRTGKSV